MDAPQYLQNEQGLEVTPELLALASGLQGQGEWSDQSSLDALYNLDLTDLLSSPGPNYSYSQFGDTEAMDTDQQEQQQQQPGIQQVDQSQVVPMANASPLPNMAFMYPDSSTNGATGHPPPQYTATGDHGNHPNINFPTDISTCSMEGSFEGIEPSMRLDSADTRPLLLEDPNLLQEKFNLIVLHPSKDNAVGQQRAVEIPRDNMVPSPQQLSSVHVAPSGLPEPCTSPDSMSSPGQGETFMTNYKLPDSHSFKVLVQFMAKPMLEEVVNNSKGCLLYYNPNQVDKTTPTTTPFTEITLKIPITTMVRTENGKMEEIKWIKEKQKRYTETILKSLDKGVNLCSRDGNIYATRKCDTKIFWASTQLTKDHALELKRETKTKIFDWEEFELYLTTVYREQKVELLDMPTVWFSFAQRWDRASCPLTTKLVWARIEPTKAREMVKNVNPNVRESTYLESLHSSNILISK